MKMPEEELTMPKQVIWVYQNKESYYFLGMTESDGQVGSIVPKLMSISSNRAPNIIHRIPELQMGELIVLQYFP